jgi:hypothetical protein
MGPAQGLFSVPFVREPEKILAVLSVRYVMARVFRSVQVAMVPGKRNRVLVKWGIFYTPF